MNPDKVGKFIKKLRKDNNLTQKDLADKYGVTYQAVSKWENGINLPDVSLIREMSKDFNISIEDILDGEITNKKEKKNLGVVIIPLVIILIIVLIIAIIVINNKPSSFSFKTVSSSCKEFNVSGSLAFNKEKSSIYISNIDYCGGDDETEYKEIQCNLYETHNETSTKISSCKSEEDNIKLEDYLSNVELNIDDYNQKCSKYNDNSLYLEINATRKDDKVITYKIPLKINDNCSKE